MSPTRTIPRYLYKYRTYDNYDGLFVDNMIRDGKFYCAHQDSFNDPFDCQLAIRHNLSSSMMKFSVKRQLMDDLFRQMETAIKQGRSERFIKQMKNELNQLTKDDHDGLVQLANRLIFLGIIPSLDMPRGILCLSADPANILMWSHYAENHTGVVVKIDTERLPETQRSLIHKVEYRRKYSNITYRFNAESSRGVAHQLRMYLYKSKLWEYEQEWRYISDDVGVVKFGSEVVCGIIFGCRARRKSIKRIKEILSKRRNDKSEITVYHAVRSEVSFDLRLDPTDTY